MSFVWFRGKNDIFGNASWNPFVEVLEFQYRGLDYILWITGGGRDG
jgi:hypothetical protein